MIVAWSLLGGFLYFVGLGLTMGLWQRMYPEDAEIEDDFWLLQWTSTIMAWPIVLSFLFAAYLTHRVLDA